MVPIYSPLMIFSVRLEEEEGGEVDDEPRKKLDENEGECWMVVASE